MFGMVACGKKEDKQEDIPVVDSDDKQEDDTTVVPDITLSEDGDTFTFTIDVMDLILVHKDEEITGMRVVVTYENSDLANAAKDEAMNKADDMVDSVTVEDNVLTAVYNEKAWEGVTFSQMQAAFEILKETEGMDINDFLNAE